MDISTEILEVKARIQKVTASLQSQLNRRVRLLAVVQKRCDHCTAVSQRAAISEQGHLHQLIQAAYTELADLNNRLKGLECQLPHERLDGEACA